MSDTPDTPPPAPRPLPEVLGLRSHEVTREPADAAGMAEGQGETGDASPAPASPQMIEGQAEAASETARGETRPSYAPPPVPPAPPAARGMGGATALALSLIVSGALGGAVFYLFQNPVEPPSYIGMQAELRGLRADVARLNAAQTALAARIAKQEDALGGGAPAKPVDADALSAQISAKLNDQIGALAGRIDALEHRAPSSSDSAAPAAAPQAAVDALASRVDSAIAAAKQDQTQALSAAQNDLTALHARLDAIEKGQGSTGDAASRALRLTRLQIAAVALATGQKLGSIADAPPALARYADAAPPTDAALRAGFPALAAAARASSRPELGFSGIWQRALARLQQVVTVRRGDDVLIGDPAAGILARAQDAVARDDLGAALAAVDQLQGPAAAVMKPWAEDARGLLAARAALLDLMSHS